MKVLIGCTAYPPDIKGGGEISTKLLADGLAQMGVEVVVLAAGLQASETWDNGVRIIRRPSPNIYWSRNSAGQSSVRKMVWHLRESWFPQGNYWAECLDRENPDLVHTSTIEDLTTDFWTVVSGRNISLVHTLRSYALLCKNAAMYRREENCRDRCLDCRVLSWPKERRSRSVDGVVGVSDFVLQKHLQAGLFPNALARVIPNSVDVDAVLSPGKCDPQSLTLGYMGRLISEKGLEKVFDSLRQAGRKDLVLRIAGRGVEEYETRLKTLAKDLHVTFEGWVEPRDFLPQIDALLVPSLWEEPFGRVVAESFAYGKPVISSRRGGLSDLVKNGINGYSYEPDDKTGLSKLILTMDTADLKKMNQACLESSRQCSMSMVAGSYASFYEEIIRKKRGVS